MVVRRLCQSLTIYLCVPAVNKGRYATVNSRRAEHCSNLREDDLLGGVKIGLFGTIWQVDARHLQKKEHRHVNVKTVDSEGGHRSSSGAGNTQILGKKLQRTVYTPWTTFYSTPKNLPSVTKKMLPESVCAVFAQLLEVHRLIGVDFRWNRRS